MPPRLGILGLLEQLLVGVGQALVVPRLAVEAGDRPQRLQIVGVDLQHALVDGDRLAIVAQLVADERRQLHRAPRPLGGIVGEAQLPLGDLDHLRPVLVLLVVARAGARAPRVARIELGDDLLERLGGRVDVAQPLVEDLRAQQRQLHGAPRLRRQRRLPLEDAHQHRPVPLGGVEARQRLQRLGVGRQEIRQLLPGLARARNVVQRPLGQPRQRRRYSACAAGSATTRSTSMSSTRARSSWRPSAV